MCGRFARYIENQLLIQELMGEFPDLVAGDLPDWPASYNIPPTLPILTLGQSKPERPPRLNLLRWGFIPAFAMDLKGHQPHNAKAETLATSGMFRASFARRRCLVIANGFFEWKTTDPPGGKGKPVKTPYFAYLEGEPFYCMAGIYDVVRIGADALASCAIVTTAALGPMADVHHRMPVVITREGWRRWIDPTLPGEAVADLLEPGAWVARMRLRQVGPQVSTRVDAPVCIEPATASAASITHQDQGGLFD